MNDIYDSLSPLERKVLPFLTHSFKEIIEKSQLDEVSVLRALKFLENKGLVSIHVTKKTIVDLGVNGIQYRKKQLPERTLLGLLEKKNILPLSEIQNHIKLSDNEFKSAIGALRKKDLIAIEQEKIVLKARKEELIKKFPEELLIEKLPLEKEVLSQEQHYALELLEKRKEIIQIIEKKNIKVSLTPKGHELLAQSKKVKEDLIERVTPELIKEGVKNKRFRKYDLIAPVPRIWGGKKNSVQFELERAKKIWLELGFKEMTGKMVDSSFWVFDALFTAQDHPVREMQDTFYIKQMHADLPETKIVENVKKAHEHGVE